jgi:hypothetical protein
MCDQETEFSNSLENTIPYGILFWSLFIVTREMEGEVMHQTDQDQMTEGEYKAKFEFIDATLLKSSRKVNK